MVYRDSTVRVTLPQIRAHYAPRDFRQREQVTLEAAGVRVLVKLVHEASPGAHGGSRVWMACPRCSRRTQTVGLVPEFETGQLAWACARNDCGAWRSRKRPSLAALPAPASASPRV